MLIQKSKVKQLIRDQGLRCSPDSFDGINRAVESIIKQLCSNVLESGMKTMMTQHTIPKNKNGSNVSNGKCKKCVNIKPEFLKFARSTQVYCHEQAVILSNDV